MAHKSWQHTRVATAAQAAADLVPDQIAVGPTTLELTGRRTAEAAYWGQDAARFPARWSHGRWQADAYVETRPISAHAAEIVVHLRSPEGPLGWLMWPSDRLDRRAASLAAALRYEIDILAESETGPVTARRMAAPRTKTA